MGFHRRKQFILKSPNVPLKRHSSFFFFIILNTITILQTIIFFSSKLQTINCENYQIFRPESSQYDHLMENYNDNIRLPYNKRHTNDYVSGETDLFAKPTPKLDLNLITSSKSERNTFKKEAYANNNQENGQDYYNNEQNFSIDNTDIKNISPAQVIERQHYIYGPDYNLFSPIFNLQSLDFNLAQINYPQSSNYQAQQSVPTQNSFDTNNDLVESGSGSWDNNLAPDDNSNIMEDSTTLNQFNPSSIVPTQVLTPNFGTLATPLPNDSQNKPPILNRRLPKLAITSGQFWRYFIPSDSFLDEEGDMRQLRSRILRKSPVFSNVIDKQAANITNNPNQESFGQFYSWLQYDQNSLLLYGFPTEDDAGMHELVLEVTDRWGSSSSEIIEIHVKQHQSTRAFTHSIVINRVDWDGRGYQSMIDAIGELIKRISSKMYLDFDFRNLIVQYYTFDKQPVTINPHGPPWSNDEMLQNDRRGMNTSFTIAWSNASLPIHPCNLSQLEILMKPLIAYRYSSSNWSLYRDEKIELEPSQNLTRIMGPEFKPTNISIHLQGTCETIDLSNKINEQISPDSTPRTQIKIGKLNWKLGEPIRYQIPAETFSDEKGSQLTRKLKLTVHTIDGLVLDKDHKYNFLEFDSETQTLYGLPYSQENHAGQRELQLTARHPLSGRKAREVFIVNIVPQDLTSINNRAFRMSLYLSTRTGLFGPRERVNLSQKIFKALGAGDPDFDHDQLNPELTVIGVQKFAIRNRRDYISSVPSGGDNYADDVVGLLDITNDDQIDNFYMSKEEMRRDEATSLGNAFYKFTWTNGTIGYRGDCPMEVIKENILYALEQSMLKFKFVGPFPTDEPAKNDSAKFYDRLRLYFEPESSLIHLRFEPLGACTSALEVHDVGNNGLADNVDRISEFSSHVDNFIVDLTTPIPVSPSIPKIDSDASNEEYWSIVVLIILVVALIFVIIMFFMGMHTYKINQDKRFELQMRLAQARQNSMFLSSMILAQASPNDMLAPGAAKSICHVHEEEKGSRKPVILDKEKQLLSGCDIPTQVLKSTAVQHNGKSYETTSVRPDVNFALNQMTNGWQQGISLGPQTIMHNYMDGKQHAVTLNRRPSSLIRGMSRQNTSIGLNPSQSVLTVASLAGPVIPLTPQANFSGMYTPVLIDQAPQSYSMSLQRSSNQQRPILLPDVGPIKGPSYMVSTPDQTLPKQAPPKNHSQRIPVINGLIINDSPYTNKLRSPSYSSSTSATTHSVISNSNYHSQIQNIGPTNAL